MNLSKNKIIAGVIGLVAVVGVVNTQAIVKLSNFAGDQNQAAIALSKNESVLKQESTIDKDYKPVIKKPKSFVLDEKNPILIITKDDKSKDSYNDGKPASGDTRDMWDTDGTIYIASTGNYDIRFCGGGGGGGGGAIGVHDPGYNGNSNDPGSGGGGGGGGTPGECAEFNEMRLNQGDEIMFLIGDAGLGGRGGLLEKNWGSQIETTYNGHNSDNGQGGTPTVVLLNGETVIGTASGGVGGYQGLSPANHLTPGVGGLGGSTNNQWVNDASTNGQNGRLSSFTGCISCGGIGGRGIPEMFMSYPGNTELYFGYNLPWYGGIPGQPGLYVPGQGTFAGAVAVTSGSSGADGYMSTGGYGGGGGAGVYIINPTSTNSGFPFFQNHTSYFGLKKGGDGGNGGNGYLKIKWSGMIEVPTAVQTL